MKDLAICDCIFLKSLAKAHDPVQQHLLLVTATESNYYPQHPYTPTPVLFRAQKPRLICFGTFFL